MEADGFDLYIWFQFLYNSFYCLYKKTNPSLEDRKGTVKIFRNKIQNKHCGMFRGRVLVDKLALVLVDIEQDYQV